MGPLLLGGKILQKKKTQKNTYDNKDTYTSSWKLYTFNCSAVEKFDFQSALC